MKTNTLLKAALAGLVLSFALGAATTTVMIGDLQAVDEVGASNYFRVSVFTGPGQTVTTPVSFQNFSLMIGSQAIDIFEEGVGGLPVTTLLAGKFYRTDNIDQALFADGVVAFNLFNPAVIPQWMLTGGLIFTPLANEAAQSYTVAANTRVPIAVDVNGDVVPEPATMLLAMAGLGGVLLLRRRLS